MPKLKDIEKTFRKRDYYTILENEKRSDVVEKGFYGDIDDFLGRILPSIFDESNNIVYPNVTDEIKRQLRDVVLKMAKRTPDFLKDHDDVVFGKKYVETLLSDLKKGIDYENVAKYQKIINCEDRLQDYGRDLRVRSSLEDSERVLNAFEKLSVRWVTSDNKHSFILSSKMTYWIGNGGANGLVNPLLEIWMPISPKVAIVLVRDVNRVIPYQNLDTRDHIRQVNEYAMRSSNQIASHSKELLASLVGKIAMR